MRGERVLHGGSELIEGRRSVGARHNERDDPLPPLVVVPSGDRDVGDAAHRTQHLLDGVGPDVLAAGDDEVAAAAVHDEPAVGVELADVAGREPSPRVLGVSAVAVAAEEHRAAQHDAAVVLVDRDLHAVERHAVVHDTAAGLGHPVGRHDIRREGFWGRRSAEHDHPEQGRVDATQRGGHERHERRPPAS